MMEAIFNDQDILEVTRETIEDLKRRALASPRKRFRLCMHHSTEHLTQEMLIVFHKDTFMPPHRHVKGKSESWHILEGSMTAHIFNDEGKIIRSIEMEKEGSEKAFLCRLESNAWHMQIPTSEWLVFHETRTGPFKRDYDVEFPPWAPQEEDKEKVERFLADIAASFHHS